MLKRPSYAALSRTLPLPFEDCSPCCTATVSVTTRSASPAPPPHAHLCRLRQACVDWSCSSYLLYAVRGRAKGAQPLVEGPELSRALKKLAKQHKETQTPSEVP